ncbi:MAG: hypothetical protein IJD48_04460 [Clostridia bacterium]|nr:hypothetical protein [Clostridia bacterium]
MIFNSQVRTQNSGNFFSSNFAVKIKKFLNSPYYMALVSIIISLFWSLNIGFVSIGFLAFFFILTLIFCHEDPKPVLLPIISITLMFNDLLIQGFMFVLILMQMAFSLSRSCIRILRAGKKMTHSRPFGRECSAQN